MNHLRLSFFHILLVGGPLLVLSLSMIGSTSAAVFSPNIEEADPDVDLHSWRSIESNSNNGLRSADGESSSASTLTGSLTSLWQRWLSPKGTTEAAEAEETQHEIGSKYDTDGDFNPDDINDEEERILFSELEVREALVERGNAEQEIKDLDELATHVFFLTDQEVRTIYEKRERAALQDQKDVHGQPKSSLGSIQRVGDEQDDYNGDENHERDLKSGKSGKSCKSCKGSYGSYRYGYIRAPRRPQYSGWGVGGGGGGGFGYATGYNYNYNYGYGYGYQQTNYRRPVYGTRPRGVFFGTFNAMGGKCKRSLLVAIRIHH